MNLGLVSLTDKSESETVLALLFKSSRIPAMDLPTTSIPRDPQKSRSQALMFQAVQVSLFGHDGRDGDGLDDQ